MSSLPLTQLNAGTVLHIWKMHLSCWFHYKLCSHQGKQLRTWRFFSCSLRALPMFFHFFEFKVISLLQLELQQQFATWPCQHEKMIFSYVGKEWKKKKSFPLFWETPSFLSCVTISQCECLEFLEWTRALSLCCYVPDCLDVSTGSWQLVCFLLYKSWFLVTRSFVV